MVNPYTPRELRMEVEQVDVTSMYEPDTSWKFTDTQGHKHYRAARGNPYPTLITVSDGTYWCQDCRDDHTGDHFECRLCGERITPGIRGNMFRQYIPGRIMYYLGDEPITEQEYLRLRATMSQD